MVGTAVYQVVAAARMSDQKEEAEKRPEVGRAKAAPEAGEMRRPASRPWT